jgi:hypothetical protein
MDKQDSTIVTILTFKDGTGNADLDSQIDENAIELFERQDKYNTLEKVEAALQEGIYSK